MNLTKESEYALRGLAWLATQPPGVSVPIAEIAATKQLPTSFLAKIFQKLARHGILESDRGRGSGYALCEAPSTIRVRDILEALEGPKALQRCLLWSAHCGDNEPCPLHHRMKTIRSQLDAILDEVTLAEYMEVSLAATSSPTEGPGAA